MLVEIVPKVQELTSYRYLQLTLAGFHGEQHPDNVLTLLPDYYIGNLCEDEETTKESQSRG